MGLAHSGSQPFNSDAPYGCLCAKLFISLGGGRREERRWILDRVCIKQEWHTGPKVNFPEMCLEGKLQEI